MSCASNSTCEATEKIVQGLPVTMDVTDCDSSHFTDQRPSLPLAIRWANPF